jgi:hypothetical protein
MDPAHALYADRLLPYDFANRRHIGPSPQEMVEMLGLLGPKRSRR